MKNSTTSNMTNPIRKGRLTKYWVVLKLMETGTRYSKEELEAMTGSNSAYSILIGFQMIQQNRADSKYGITDRGIFYVNNMQEGVANRVGKNKHYLPTFCVTNEIILTVLKPRMDEEFGFAKVEEPIADISIEAVEDSASNWKVTIEKGNKKGNTKPKKTMIFENKQDAVELMICLVDKKSVTRTTLVEVAI